MKEDLRQYYITPLYIETLKARARNWTDEFIRFQFDQFAKSIPDYPEVLEILEGELHRRKLNNIRRILRSGQHDAKTLLAQYGKDEDCREVIETEQSLKNGSLPSDWLKKGQEAERKNPGILET